MIFNILYGVLSVFILTLAGCQKVNQDPTSSVAFGQCSSAPKEKPLESCAKSLDSLQDQANQPHLKSTELTSGQFEYSSGEILIDRQLASGDRLRIHAVESMCMDPTSGKTFPRLDLICQESLNKVPTKIEMSEFAPRMINVKRDERSADAYYRGVIMSTPDKTLAYRFEDSDLKLNMTRTDFETQLTKAFDESYFIRKEADVYIFIGKKKQPDGSSETIRMTLRKVGGDLMKDSFLFDPTPDSIFKI